jgi:hypothetical protein
MVSWSDVEAEAPEFARRVRELFQAGRHKTLATLRADGSPRISGIETRFDDAGEVTFGSMPGSVKERDIARDPRIALHSPSADPPEGSELDWVGEAKVAGSAIAAGDGFRVDITEVVLTRLGATADPAVADHLVIESWHPGRGYERRTRV